MSQGNQFLRKALLSLYTLLVSVMVSFLPLAPVEAQNFWQRVTAPFQRRRGIGIASDRDRGAAVRDPDLCPYTEQSLTAFVPNRNEVVLTSEDYPAFWFYVPYPLTPNPAEFTLRFVLQDETFTDVYSSMFTMPEDIGPGILSLQLTAEDAALETGKTYRWYFLIYCNDEQRIYEPAFVEGAIRRQALPAAAESTAGDVQMTLRDQFQAYAEANIWYEAFDVLGVSRWTNVDNPISAEGWRQTLQAIELEPLTDQPIIGRYEVPDTVE